MAEKLSENYVFSWKPNPAHIAQPELNEELIRLSMRETTRKTKNCRVQIIMKDNHTIGRNPQNVINWCRIAKEEVERQY